MNFAEYVLKMKADDLHKELEECETETRTLRDQIKAQERYQAGIQKKITILNQAANAVHDLEEK